MSVKLCSDRIIFSFKHTSFIGKLNTNSIRSSLFTLQRQYMHSNSIVRSFHTNSYYNHHIISFCTQTKKHKDENELDEESDEIHTNNDNEQLNITNNESESIENDNEYEEEYESEYESEYEYEYETDEEFEDENDNEINEQTMDNTIETIEKSDQKQTTEISENFDFNLYSENVMNELFINLPKEGRIESKPIEHFISALILKPLELLEDEIHNKFTLMHNDMNKLMENAYKIPIENESELRDIIDLSFDKLNIYSAYIENNFNLRHSPKHYLLRQLRIDHGNIVYLAMRKIMYYKYPKWVENDNWANEEMSEHNKRKFVISNELGIGLENLENVDDIVDNEEIENGNENIESNDIETEEVIIETDEQQKEL